MKKTTILYLICAIPCLFLTEIVFCDEANVVFVGDIMLSRGVGKTMKNLGHKCPFEKTAKITQSADLTFGNLECCISNRGTPKDKKYTFRASTDTIKGLKYAGVDIVTIANNHSMDYYSDALNDTVSSLNKKEIMTIGARVYLEKPLDKVWDHVVTEVKGVKFAFFGYDMTYVPHWKDYNNRKGLCPAQKELIVSDINKVRESVDIVVVTIHWGQEYKAYPTDTQKTLAHAVIDAGADIIIGHHPHVIQGVEFYKNKPIFYSLGNFIFDQKFDETIKSMIISCKFSDIGIEKIYCIPIMRTYRNYYPQLAKGKSYNDCVAYFKKISRPLNASPDQLGKIEFQVPIELASKDK